MRGQLCLASLPCHVPRLGAAPGLLGVPWSPPAPPGPVGVSGLGGQTPARGRVSPQQPMHSGTRTQAPSRVPKRGKGSQRGSGPGRSLGQVWG